MFASSEWKVGGGGGAGSDVAAANTEDTDTSDGNCDLDADRSVFVWEEEIEETELRRDSQDSDEASTEETELGETEAEKDAGLRQPQGPLSSSSGYMSTSLFGPLKITPQQTCSLQKSLLEKDKKN